MRLLLLTVGVIGLGSSSEANGGRVHPQAVSSQQPDIVVGANVQVSQDEPFPHTEPWIAASPIDPKVLIAATSVWPFDGPKHDRIYVSYDRGNAWQAIVIPELARNGSGDPMVGVSRNGTLYFATIAKVGSGGAVLYRSADSGRTWEGPSVTGIGDRENLTVDPSTGRFAGRIYVVGAKFDGKASAARTYYSTDDGRTYRVGGSIPDCFNIGLATFADGTLFATCQSGRRRPDGVHESELGFAASTDGGKTFSPYRRVAPSRPSVPSLQDARQRLGDAAALPPVPIHVPCAIEHHPGPYRDRIYCLWAELDSATLTQRIMMTYSSDRGATWSASTLLDPTIPAWATQGMASLAVNRDGIVGAAWLDTRQSKTRDRQDLYFTASLDGGRTFLPPVRVTSVSSFPMSAGNLRPAMLAPIVLPGSAMGDELHHAVSTAAQHPTGGDYMGMAADAAGEFHPVWPDARTGTWQAYSTRIRVARTGESLTRRLPAAAEHVRTSLKGKTAVLLASSAIDSSSLEMTFLARIRNVSPDTLYGPFAVEISDVGQPTPGDSASTPKVTNASNGLTGVGARFEYAGAAGTLDLLPPGAVTDARPWRFRARRFGETRLIVTTAVTGAVRKPASQEDAARCPQE